MSCFESSTFLASHEVLNAEILKKVCDKLNWNYVAQRGEIIIYQTGKNSLNFLSTTEPQIRIRGNRVTWNTYYSRDGKQKVDQMRGEYERIYLEMRVEYALESVVSEFQKRKFTILEDLNFQPDEAVKHRFYIKGTSKIKTEDEPIAKIKVSILANGTIQTDSNYIPEDIHVLADEAMESIEKLLGVKRTISPKEIPAKYKSKAFCHVKQTTTLKNKTK